MAPGSTPNLAKAATLVITAFPFMNAIAQTSLQILIDRVLWFDSSTLNYEEHESDFLFLFLYFGEWRVGFWNIKSQDSIGLWTCIVWMQTGYFSHPIFNESGVLFYAEKIHDNWTWNKSINLKGKLVHSSAKGGWILSFVLDFKCEWLNLTSTMNEKNDRFIGEVTH
jgi:hypothetical protein